jgi:hypothetical protein
MAIILIALVICTRGAIMLLRSWRLQLHPDNISNRKLRTSIAQALLSNRKVFILSLSIYAVLFLFTSNTVIISETKLSDKYGVQIPSYYIIGCCGQPGSFPVLTIYLSEHLGLLMIPLNLILAAFLPLLVGINIAMIFNKIRLLRTLDSCTYLYPSATSSHGKWKTKNDEPSATTTTTSTKMHKIIASCGFAAGIFAACPACAGSIVFSLLFGGGTALAGTMTASLAPYQTTFAAISIGALLAAPFIMEIKRT